MKNIWKYIISGIIGFTIGILINIPSCQKLPESKIEYIEKHDTIEIEKERIVEKTRIKYIDRIDTFYVKESGDTVQIDSIPIEHKIYEDTIKNDSISSTEIKIEYSGFNAQVNEVYIHNNYLEKQEIIIQQPKKVGWVWAVGPSAGYSITINPTNGQLNHGISGGLTIMIGIGGAIK